MPRARPFHIMAKPFGSICNLDCTYCYYLEKEKLYPGVGDFRIPDEVLEAFVRQYIGSQDSPEVGFAWQGGEPTLLGLEFFKKVVDLQAKYADGKQISNVIQTNGTRLDDAWCEFLATHGFLVGLSVDGPRELHDAYRVDKGGKPSFDRVMEGLALLKKHGTEFNTLTVVNRLNSQHPQKVYDFLKSIGSRFFQFIPLVEREADEEAKGLGLSLAGPPPMASLPVLGSGQPAPGSVSADSEEGPDQESPREGPEQESPPVTPWSVEPRQFGEFLVAIFDHWVRSDVGQVFVQIFDITLAGWMGMEPPLCVFAETCGHAMALEHNGDLYSCDHYVYPGYRLGNILDTDLQNLARSPFQVVFGEAKREELPQYCLDCEVRFLCNGECPKHRFIMTPDGEPGLNYLCAGYKRFFTHSGPQMEIMAELLRQRRPAAEIMQILAAQDRDQAMRSAGRNDPCPCGSGKKFKLCCGGG